MNGTAVSNEAMRATKKAPLMPTLVSGKPMARMTKYSRSASVVQMSTVANGDGHQAPPVDREQALLELVVQGDDAMRHRKPGEDPASEVAHHEQAHHEHQDHHETDREDDLDFLGHPRPEAPEARREPQDHDRDEVEDTLDEDGAEGLAELRPRC